MNATEKLPFEQAAEHRTNIEGWVCKTCRRFWGDDERMARWCCAGDLKCSTDGCEARVQKNGWTICEPCQEKRTIEKWKALPEAAWDGETPLVVEGDDTYLYSEDGLISYMEENDLTRDVVMLRICERDAPPSFEILSFLEDYLPEGLEYDADWDKIDKAVNYWIEENVPVVWIPGETRPTTDSLPIK